MKDKTLIEANDELHTKKEKLLVIVGAILFGVFMFIATCFEWLAYPEQLTQDMLYKSDEPINNDIKIIAIDEKSIEALGDYNQWSRQIYADLVNILCQDECKPDVIGFDVMFFAERDEVSDEAFAKACEEAGNVVLASQLNVGYDKPQEVENGEAKVYWPGTVMLPFDELNKASDSGFVDIILDNDGFLRHTLLSVETNQGVVCSFAMAVSKKYCEVTGNEFIEPKTDATGSMLIQYVGDPGSYEYISLCDVLDGTVPATVFDGSIVLIGSYAETMMDSYNVMVDRRSRMFGVEVNANIVQNILSGNQLQRPSLLIVAIINGVVAGVLLYITNKKRIRALSVVVGITLITHFVFCIAMYDIGILWYVSYMVVGLVMVYIINVVWKYIYEQREKERDTALLLFSMAEAMTEAIDQRTPYNASHTINVAKYSVELANYVNKQYKKKRTKIHFSYDDITQLKLAALLHDVGKLSVPLEILDKPTRLGAYKEDLFVRLEKIELLCKLDLAEKNRDEAVVKKELKELEEIRNIVNDMDKKEFLQDEDKKLIEDIICKEYVYADGEKLSYFTQKEKECLLIPKGTLTADEMEMVHHHAIYTDEILERIRFGKNYNKVRHMAASHHEFINGKGYPKHLQGEEIDASTRILTICDVYDALTADDRPYKKAKTKEQTFKILGFMAKDKEIDEELFGFARELWSEEV